MADIDDGFLRPDDAGQAQNPDEQNLAFSGTSSPRPVPPSGMSRAHEEAQTAQSPHVQTHAAQVPPTQQFAQAPNHQDQPTQVRPAASVAQTQAQQQAQQQGRVQAQQQAQTQAQQQARPQAYQTHPRHQYQAPAGAIRVAPARPQKRWPAFVSGLIGAILGASVMMAGGALAVRSGRFQLPATTESSAGPTVTIESTEDDVTISKAVAAKALPSVVSIYVTTGSAAGVGSGVIMDTQGNILTNYHVIEDARSIQVTLNGKSYEAAVVGNDASSDLAVIHVDLDGEQVTPIEVGDSDSLVVGDWVMAIGSPYGLDQSVSTGIVSSLYRSTMLPSTSGTQIYANLIQTDAAINPGNSGGALVNSEGKLVGINSIIESASGASAGIGFAIAGNYAIDVAKAIIAGEDVLHAYIGLSLQTVTAYNAQQAGLSVNQGAFVAEVTSGGPGDDAGLQVGDVITSVGNQKIISADALILAVRSHSVGETVDITYVRGDEEHSVQVTLGEDSVLQEQRRQQQQQQKQQQQQQDQGFSPEDLFGGSLPDGYGNGYDYGGSGSGAYGNEG